MQELPIGPLYGPIAVSIDRRILNAFSSLKRELPRFVDLRSDGLGKACNAALVSGGPSLAQQLDTVRKFQVIIACGSCHDYLIEHGITPSFCAIFDPGEDHARFYRKPVRDVTYLVSSTCDPSVFDALDGYDVRVWHPFDDLPEELYNYEPRVGGGSTVTLRAIPLAHIMGFREQHLFGFDCSFQGGYEHAYPYEQDRPPPITVNLDGLQFQTSPALLQQAQEFCRMFHDHQNNLACVIYGDGLMAAMWKVGARVTLPMFQ